MEEKREKREGFGRPPIDISKDRLETMLMYGASQWECAAQFNCHEATIARFVEEHYDMTFAELRSAEFSKTQLRLKQAQIRSALGTPVKKTYFKKKTTTHKDGTKTEEMIPYVMDEELPPNIAMQMWLGKQLLGQSEDAKLDQDLESMRARFEKPIIRIEVQNADGTTIQQLEQRWSDQAKFIGTDEEPKPVPNGHDKPQYTEKEELDDLEADDQP